MLLSLIFANEYASKSADYGTTVAPAHEEHNEYAPKVYQPTPKNEYQETSPHNEYQVTPDKEYYEESPDTEYSTSNEYQPPADAHEEYTEETVEPTVVNYAPEDQSYSDSSSTKEYAPTKTTYEEPSPEAYESDIPEDYNTYSGSATHVISIAIVGVLSFQ